MNSSIDDIHHAGWIIWNHFVNMCLINCSKMGCTTCSAPVNESGIDTEFIICDRIVCYRDKDSSGFYFEAIWISYCFMRCTTCSASVHECSIDTEFIKY